ncbi:hypothetical protein PsYK624_148620 [Phanerochaete sordida]|uniref:Uncharacterized protein n=1 Tax=Phanerochaete sordida TaxID=48140 RepID=A0A9P3GMP8_9APHY|nr:hypothetical protein PsYK624_148620 [Phanerochaete sordida]
MSVAVYDSWLISDRFLPCTVIDLVYAPAPALRLLQQHCHDHVPASLLGIEPTKPWYPQTERCRGTPGARDLVRVGLAEYVSLPDPTRHVQAPGW